MKRPPTLHDEVVFWHPRCYHRLLAQPVNLRQRSYPLLNLMSGRNKNPVTGHQYSSSNLLTFTYLKGKWSLTLVFRKFFKSKPCARTVICSCLDGLTGLTWILLYSRADWGRHLPQSGRSSRCVRTRWRSASQRPGKPRLSESESLHGESSKNGWEMREEESMTEWKTKVDCKLQHVLGFAFLLQVGGGGLQQTIVHYQYWCSADCPSLVTWRSSQGKVNKSLLQNNSAKPCIYYSYFSGIFIQGLAWKAVPLIFSLFASIKCTVRAL